MKPSKKPDPYSLDSGEEAQTADLPATTASASEKFSATLRGNVHVITLSKGNVLDAFEIDALGKELQAYIQSAGTPNLVVDLSNVHHLSSAALGMLVTLKSNADAHGGGLHLANVRDDLKKIFKITKLHKVLKIHKDVDAASKSF